MKLSLGVLFATFVCGCASTSSTVVPAAEPPPATLYGAPIGDAALSIGSAAPDFAAVAHDGADLRLSSLRGREVLLFFYSKDDGPGPTREASGFRDSWAELTKRGVVVIGISTDTLESHKDFAQHLRLPFHLVSDANGTIAHAYGVDDTYGVLARDTVLVDQDGLVKKVYRSVDVTKHVNEVLTDL